MEHRVAPSKARSALQRSTKLFALHQIPLECDIYDAPDYPKDGPVFLFFHAGGLVAGLRSAIPPWLVQVCYQRQWPLVSASYRLLPQVDGGALLDDAHAAYNFARTLDGEAERPVVVGGASAGFFLAALIAHHVDPKPAALLSISGIPTFRHPFFNSSYCITPVPLDRDELSKYFREPVAVGTSTFHVPTVFEPDFLCRDGTKNPDARPRDDIMLSLDGQDPGRGALYDYFVSSNEFLSYLDSVDPGFDWAASDDPQDHQRLDSWPVTIFLQGDQDISLDKAVSLDTAAKLGPRAIYLNVSGQGHTFGRSKFLEDEERKDGGPDAMEVVKRAVAELDRLVADYKPHQSPEISKDAWSHPPI